MDKKIKYLIDKIADIKPSRIPNDPGMVYCSKYDGSYLARVGLEEDLKLYLKHGITEQIQSTFGKIGTANLGFNPITNTWWGWSHRAKFGFTIGSKCEKGDCHYRASNKKEFIEACIRFWSSDERKNVTAKEIKDKRGIIKLYISWTYSDSIKNVKLRSAVTGTTEDYPLKWGRGEWVAKTMEDAKQMAIDFAARVS